MLNTKRDVHLTIFEEHVFLVLFNTREGVFYHI